MTVTYDALYSIPSLPHLSLCSHPRLLSQCHSCSELRIFVLIFPSICLTDCYNLLLHFPYLSAQMSPYQKMSSNHAINCDLLAPGTPLSLKLFSIAHWSPIRHFVFMLAARSCLTVCSPWIVTCQAPLTMEFSSQEFWSGLPFPIQGIFWTQGLNPCPLYLRH